MTTRTITDDVQDDAFDDTEDAVSTEDEDIDSATELLLKRWKVAAPNKEPSAPAKKEQAERAQETETEEHEAEESDPDKKETDEADEGHEEENADEGEGDDEAKDGEKPESKQLASDDHEVEITVDGEARRVPVKDLKRLFGQEASLTRKSQEVATLRTQAEQVGTTHRTALDTLMKRAQERWAPYSKIDFLVAQGNLSKEEFAELRRQAQQAWADVQFYGEELKTVSEKAQKGAQEAFQKASKDCIAALSDEKTGIKGWNEKLYGELREYAAEGGLPAEAFNRITAPLALKFMHKAMLYDRAQKIAVKKIATAPKNVAKNKSTDGGAKPAQVAQRKAMEKLRASGELDDAADAFMSRWNVRDRD